MTWLSPLPPDAREFMDWQWSRIAPYYEELAARALTSANVETWLTDWSHLNDLLDETYQRLYVATSRNTADSESDQKFKLYLDTIFPDYQSAEQKLKQKLLASGLEPPGFEVPLRNIRAEVAIFRVENLPLLADEQKLEKEYDKIIGAQTVTLDGAEKTLTQLIPLYQDPDRARREQVWRLAKARQLADRDALNALWQRCLTLRRQLAANAGFDNYRSYRWQQLLRFDYTPEDCKNFHDAIEQVVTPAVARIYERRRRRLGVDSLRPWDLQGPLGYENAVDPPDVPPLRPFEDVDELVEKCNAMFHRVDPKLGDDFAMMRREWLLDLENRKGKAPGAYCTQFAALKRPFIFMNAVGLHDDVQTLLHEGGHGFHVFESNHLPYYQQRAVGSEIAEVASMAMELLAAPYLSEREGGFYSEVDAARARREHLEEMIIFWSYMAIVDAFQHWVYENADAALNAVNCDARWEALWRRFMPGVDWSGFEAELRTGWHRKLHIFTVPFYYVEYGLAQLGAAQVWRNALSDQAGAVASYRRALSLGGTRPLPALYAAAGAKFAFDANTLQSAVALMEEISNVG